MERILVPSDGSPLAEAILPIVVKLAQDWDAEVILLRAEEAQPPPGEEMTGAEVRALGESRLRALASTLEGHGLKRVRWMVWSADPVQAIRDAARAQGADLIAMATHSRGGLSRLLLGSVAAGVVQAVSVPVLLLRGRLSETTWSLRRLLVPLSGEAGSEAILPVVEGLAGPADLEVHLVEVLEPFPTTAEYLLREEEFWALRRVEAERHLEKVAEGLSVKGLRVTRSVLAGPVAETIISAAVKGGADLITMATHGRGLLGRLAFGSVADAVLRAAPVPVLLLRISESV